MYTNPQVLGYSDPSAARALLGAYKVPIHGRSRWSKYLTILEHGVIREGSTYRRLCPECMVFYNVENLHSVSMRIQRP